MAIAHALASEKEKPANDSLSDIPTEIFNPTNFVAERK
jgi:hypothetical protein